MKYICGIDGGGTSTKVLSLYENGKHIFHSFSAFNINSIGEKRFSELLARIAEYLCQVGECQALCIGAAGISNVVIRKIISSTLNDIGIQNFILLSDCDISMKGALNGRPGIVILSGTGSACFGMNEAKETLTIGGWGHLIGDEGSGFAVGRDAIKLIAKAFDGMFEHTQLCNLLCKEFDINSKEEIIRFVYNGDKSRIAALSKYVLKAAIAGDNEAKLIIVKNIEELVNMVQHVFYKLGFSDTELALSGGMFEDNYYEEAFKIKMRECNSRIKCIRAERSPVEGALLFAEQLIKIQ